MNNWLSLVLAAVLGTVSAVALNGWKNAQEEALRKEYVTRPILVTEHSIKAGTAAGVSRGLWPAAGSAGAARCCRCCKS